jgi:hypothetical protein
MIPQSEYRSQDASKGLKNELENFHEELANTTAAKLQLILQN